MSEAQAVLAHALAASLLASLWQGAVVAVMAAACLRLMRGSVPQARYAVACLALACCVLLPATTFIAALARQRQDFASFELWTRPAEALVPRLLDVPLFGWESTLSWGWVAGCGLLLVRTAVAAIGLGRLVRRSTDVGEERWQSRQDAIAARLGIARPVRLLLSSELSMPAAAGLARPVVFLPIAVTLRMPVEWIEALLAHELAHIVRHDYLVNLAQRVIEAVLFHHPAVWWLSRRIRDERELIADELAVRGGAERRVLAAVLAELAEWQAVDRASASLAVVASAGGGRLLLRVRSLVRPRRRTGPGAVVPTTVLLAVVAALAGGPAPSAIADPSASTERLASVARVEAVRQSRGPRGDSGSKEYPRPTLTASRSSGRGAQPQRNAPVESIRDRSGGGGRSRFGAERSRDGLEPLGSILVRPGSMSRTLDSLGSMAPAAGCRETCREGASPGGREP